MTKRLTLLKSKLTSKIIRFSYGRIYDKKITDCSLSVNKIASDTTNYKPYYSNMDFSQSRYECTYELQLQCQTF